MYSFNFRFQVFISDKCFLMTKHEVSMSAERERERERTGVALAQAELSEVI